MLTLKDVQTGFSSICRGTRKKKETRNKKGRDEKWTRPISFSPPVAVAAVIKADQHERKLWSLVFYMWCKIYTGLFLSVVTQIVLNLLLRWNATYSILPGTPFRLYFLACYWLIGLSKCGDGYAERKDVNCAASSIFLSLSCPRTYIDLEEEIAIFLFFS